MPDNTRNWINLPAGSSIEVSLSGPEGGYTAHADVVYTPPSSAIPPGSRQIPRKDLDPGPVVIRVPQGATVSATIYLIFLSSTTITVEVHAVLKGPEGTVLDRLDTSASGKQGDGVAVVSVSATGLPVALAAAAQNVVENVT